MKHRIRYLSLIVFFVIFMNTSNANAGAIVSGSIVNSLGQPVPGVTVSLFHRDFGRSAPSMSNMYGQYIFYGIPIHPIPYFIEVYWGRQLIYRYQIQVNNSLTWNIHIR